MTKLKRIFYIYTEASMAVLYIVGAALEALCFAYFTYIGADLFQWITGAAALGFASIAAANVRYIVKREVNA
jgi:hypothetical protein